MALGKMTDRELKQLALDVPFFWSGVSLAAPVAAFVFVVAVLALSGGGRGVGGDMIGASLAIIAAAGLGIASVFGFAAAVYAIKKGEKWIGFAYAGLLLNLTFGALGCAIVF